jgi:hypothetical protein
MHRLLAVLAILSLPACTSLDDVRQQPARWFAYSPVPFDTMANCIAARMAQWWAVTPQIYSRQDVAYVTLADNRAPSIVAEFTIRQQSGGMSFIEWRRRKLPVDFDRLEARSRAAVDLCDRS